MKKFGELKKVESKPNFNLESKMSRSDAVVRQRNKPRYPSKKAVRADLEIGFPTLSILKVYNGSFSFDCDLCRGHFYYDTKGFKGCPSCITFYLCAMESGRIFLTNKIPYEVAFYRSGSRHELIKLKEKWDAGNP